MPEPPPQRPRAVLITLVTVVFFLTIVLLARHAHHQFEQTLVSLTEQQLLMTAKATAKSIERHLADHIVSLTDLANAPAFALPLAAPPGSTTRQWLHNFYDSHRQEVLSISLLDARGVTLDRYPAWDDGRDQRGNGSADEQLITELLRGHPAQVSQPFANKLGKMVVQLLVPIKGEQGTQGVILTVADIETLTAIYIQPLKFGCGAFPILIDDQGRFLSSLPQNGNNASATAACGFSNQSAICAQQECPTLTTIRQQTSQGKAGVNLFDVKESGDRTETNFIAYAPIELPGRNWTLGVVLPYSAISGPINRHLHQALGLLLCVLVAFAVGAALLSRALEKRHALEIEARYLKEIADKAKELERANMTLKEQAIRDELTGLFNYRYFHKVLQRDFALAQRHSSDYSCMIVDLDHFKQVNDSYGHVFGDYVLKGIGRILADISRETDVVARYGGEEFVILLPDTDLNGSMTIAERIRSRMESHIHSDGTHSQRVTASIGVASFRAHHPQSPQDLLAYADKALYQAKSEQRNRVVIYT